MNKEENQLSYNEDYYNYHCGIEYNRNEHWEKFFGDIADRIIKDFDPKKVLDAGCAKGFLVEALRDRGVEAYGIDISEYAINEVRNDIKPYCKVKSILDPLEDTYDLILNIEVLEHLQQEQDINIAIKNICSHTNKVIFSSSPHDLREVTHYNVKSIEEWVEKFYDNGFVRDVEYDSSFIANQAIFFYKSNSRVQQIIKDYERKFYRLYNENVELRKELSDMTIRFDIIAKQVEPLKKANDEYSKIYEETQKYVEHLKGLIEEEKNRNLELNEKIDIDKKIKKILKDIENIKETGEFGSRYKELSSKCDEVSAINSQLAEILQSKEEYVQHLIGVINLMENSKGWKLVKILKKAKKCLGKPKKIIKLNKKLYHNLRTYGVKSTVIKAKNYMKNGGQNIYLNSKSNSNSMNESNIENWKREIASFNYNPLISIVVPVYNTPSDVLNEMINSVKNQVYTNWELCIVNASPENSDLVKVLSGYKADERINIVDLQKNEGIGANTNYGVKQAKGEFIALLDHDDCIMNNALFEVVKRLQDESEKYDFFYSDKDMMNEDGQQHFNPLYKPQWSPEIMYSANYLTHFCVIRKKIIEQVGYFDSETDGAQDWDMFIKVSEASNKICHIPNILYSWRVLATSVASGIDAKPYALEAQLKTLNNHFARKKIDANAYFKNLELSIIKIDYKIPNNFKISVVVNDSGSKEDLNRILNTISESNTEIEKEIIVVSTKKQENISIKNNNVIYVNSDSEEYWIAYQLGANKCTGDIIVFIDSKIEIQKNSILELAQWALNGEIGIIGPKFLYKDNTINNIGIVLNRDSILSCYRGALNPTYNVFGYTDWYRNFNAISYEYFAIKRSLFNQVNGYEERFNNYSQIDLCQKIRKLDLRNMYNPFSEAISENDLADIKDSMSEEYIELISKYDINEVDEYWNVNLDLTKEIPQEIVIQEETVVEKKPGLWDMYSADAKVLAEWFDFSTEELNKNNELIARSSEIEIKTVNWFLPDFDYAFYAGLYTIFRYANHMAVEKGVKNNFIIVGDTNTNRIKKEICRAFPKLSNSKVYSIPSQDQIYKIPYADASIATLWTTAYFLLKFNNTKKKFYFMQDYEPLFYPAGATYAQAETSYRFNFFGLTNTVGLRNIYVNEYNGKAEYLTPCVDNSIFYPTEKIENKKYKVFFYGRPGHPRNGFELGAMALRKLKEKLGDKVEIVTAGADWDESEHGVNGVINNLGRLKYEETGDLYRSCDVGLVLMFTKHPSYLPFELMACGTAVVSNYNPSTTWFLKNEENCILTDSSATRIAEAIMSILEDKEKREKIEKKAVEDMQIMHTNWNEQLDKLFNYMEKVRFK